MFNTNNSLRTIVLVGHRPGNPLDGEPRRPEDLTGAELQELQRLHGREGEGFRFITKNPADAETLHKLRKRPKVILVLVRRNGFKLPYEPLKATKEEGSIAPLKSFQYDKGELALVGYAHPRRVRQTA